MRLIVERDALVTALAAVNARACGKMKIPILECVLIEARDQRLQILAHWLDACCSVDLPAEIDAPGVVAVNATKLSGLVNGFAKGAQISFVASGQDIEIKAGRARYKLPTLPVADFPPVLGGAEGAGDAVRFSLPANEFSDLLGRTKVAMDDNASRPGRCGIYLHTTSGGLASCATDGFNLVLVQTEVKTPAFESITIPRDRIADLQAGIDGGDVDLECSETILSVKAGARRYTTKLVDNAYSFPTYKHVIPPLGESALIVTRVQMLASLHRLIALLGEHDVIVMKWGDDAPILTLTPHRDPSAAGEEIECEGDGMESGEFITKASRLAELMEVAPYDEVKMTFTGGMKPLRIEGANNGDVLQLIMPMDFGHKTEAAAA